MKKKIKDFVSNVWFYITHFREIRKRDKAWKEEQKKIESQAARVLNNDFFADKEDNYHDW